MFSWVAARLGCVNWNTDGRITTTNPQVSQPAWAAWIETQGEGGGQQPRPVAARLGCVNWNLIQQQTEQITKVAARLGCVNWNTRKKINKQPYFVAAHLGCVNWNEHDYEDEDGEPVAAHLGCVNQRYLIAVGTIVILVSVYSDRNLFSSLVWV